MKIDVTDQGGLRVAAEDLAGYLGLDPAAVPALMRSGAITSLYEEGRGEDAGRFRVTFRHGQTRLRFTCARDGTVLSHIRTQTGR
jgi:hypothetical protein